MTTRVEVCVESVEGCVAAARAGADRVELCSGLSEGGTTPSLGTVDAARSRVELELVVLVRPRSGDFLYDALEFEVMQRDINELRALGADGVALGLLHPDGSVDVERTAQLVALARPMKVTFHRAFDYCRDRVVALGEVVAAQADRVLTSGGAGRALEGAEELRRLVEVAGSTVDVVAAGGVRADHVRELVERSGVGDVHFSAGVRRPSAMTHRNAACSLASGSPQGPFERTVTDEELVRRTIRALA